MVSSVGLIHSNLRAQHGEPTPGYTQTVFGPDLTTRYTKGTFLESRDPLDVSLITTTKNHDQLTNVPPTPIGPFMANTQSRLLADPKNPQVARLGDRSSTNNEPESYT